ncbi:MAG: hypothetical protein K2W82_11210 [Candidatus Obscuribacterales bacterium]|nr:hypothetical protein [Candidatus Obscuribacterales bacterium]
MKTQSSTMVTAEYRGKHFTLPVFSPEEPYIFSPRPERNKIAVPDKDPIIENLNAVWDLQNFKIPRFPVSLGVLPSEMHSCLSKPCGMPRTLDLPIKFPGSNVRVPHAFGPCLPLLKRIFDYEATVNRKCYDEYYCYLTVDAGHVKGGSLQREAPCHVDGFQGARWNPKVRCNHTYTVSNVFPTAYYVQPFDFDQLDERKHNFFWEMNRQVAVTNSAYARYPAPYELTLMDCFSVHRGTEATYDAFRTFVRVSFEVRIFDRLGNAHNPLFAYDWTMVPRDIEELNLVAFDESSDPSLRVFPWQNTNGEALPKGEKTKPKLRTDS